MDIKEIIQIFGLPEDASEEDVRTALKAGAQAIGDLAAERARAESSEDDATPTSRNFGWQMRNRT